MNTLTKRESNREVAPAETRYLTPSVDIRETKDEYILEADMPGVAKEGLEVLLEGGELTLVGHRASRVPAGQALHRESSPWGYRRTFVLDPAIEIGRATAHMDQGVLTVRLPKAEQVKPRRIAVGD
jgi:HSP20 family protein